MSVQALQLTERTRMLVTGIVVGDKETVVPPEKLLSPGTVKLLLPYSATREGYATVPGTDIVISIATGCSEIVIDSIPEGIIPAIIYTANDTTGTLVVLRNVQVIS